MRLRALMIALLAVSLVSAPALAQTADGTVVGSPGLSLSIADNHFTASERASIDVHISNDGSLLRGGPGEFESMVKTARDVKLEVDSEELERRYDGAIESKSGTVSVGSVPEGSVGPVSFAVELSDSLEPGTYDIPVEMSYNYYNYISYSNTDAPTYHHMGDTVTEDVTIVIEDRPRFELDSIAEQQIIAGDSTSREITITNEGTQTATDATIQLNSRNPGVFFGGPTTRQASTNVHVGNLEPGESTTASVKVGADSDADPGTYPVESWLTYKNENGVEERSDTHRQGFEVIQQPRFTIVETESQNVLAGDTGRQQVTIENTGPDTAYDAALTLTAKDSNVFFGALGNPTPSTEVYLGQLEPGERTQVSVQVGASAETIPQGYPISARVNYEDEKRVEKISESMKIGVDVGPEQTFDVEHLESTLRVGDDGDVRGTLTNEGPDTVSNVVLVYQSENSNLFPRETEYAMGTLEPGESKSFDFRVDVSSEAEAGPRQLSYVVRYRNSFDDLRKSDAVDASADVGPEVDEFSLETVNSTVTAGSSKSITVEVTNVGDQPLEDIEAKLFTDDPISSDDDTAYIDRLEPGESTEIVFGVNAAGTAIAKSYPVSIDFSYEDARGDTELSDTYRLPVTVDTPEDQGPPMGLLIGIAVVVLAILAWWQRDSITSRLG